MHTHTLTLLGRDAIRNTMVSICVGQIYSTSRISQRFLQHVASTAVQCDTLAALTRTSPWQPWSFVTVRLAPEV